MDQNEEVKFCESNCANGSHKKFYISYDQGLSSYMGIRGLRKMSIFAVKTLEKTCSNLNWKFSDGTQQKGINCDARLLLVVTPILCRIFGLSTSSPAPKWALRSEKCGWDDNRCRNKWMSWDTAAINTLACSTSTNKPKGIFKLDRWQCQIMKNICLWKEGLIIAGINGWVQSLEPQGLKI